ncbi:MAG: hypothetical protein ABIF77_01110 [bacterium]
MSRLLLILLTLCLVSIAFAGDDGAIRNTPVKFDNHLGSNPGMPDGREGGETIATAIAIASLPFTDTGNTTDNIDDYDEACTYTGSTSPDVVYSYVATGNDLLMIDLCLSTYDTKVYVYENGWTPGSPLGCNDDYYFGDPPECWTYSSYLEVMTSPGNTYYIVVDGYGGDSGNYNIVVDSEPFIPCTGITCDPNALPEGEPTLVTDYVDNYNGGCNSAPNIFQSGNWIDQSGCLHMNGVSGWYPYLGSDYRDTDWIEVYANGTEITVTIETDNDLTLTRCMMTDMNPACTGYGYSFQTSAIEGCDEWNWTVPTTPGGRYWVFVAPAEWISGPLEFNYCLEICGITYDVIPTESASWGTVKSLYR